MKITGTEKKERKRERDSQFSNSMINSTLLNVYTCYEDSGKSITSAINFNESVEPIVVVFLF